MATTSRLVAIDGSASKHEAIPTVRHATPRLPGSTPEALAVKVDDLRLETTLPVGASSPATVVKFQMLNTGSRRLTDIIFEVSVVEKLSAEESPGPPRVVAGPYAVRVRYALAPQYSLNYEMRLENIPVDCDCAATVDILSARPLDGMQSSH